MADELSTKQAGCEHCPSPATCGCPSTPEVCRTGGCVCDPTVCPCPGAAPGPKRPPGGCLPWLLLLILLLLLLWWLLGSGGDDPAPPADDADETSTPEPDDESDEELLEDPEEPADVIDDPVDEPDDSDDDPTDDPAEEPDEPQIPTEVPRFVGLDLENLFFDMPVAVEQHPGGPVGLDADDPALSINAVMQGGFLAAAAQNLFDNPLDGYTVLGNPSAIDGAYVYTARTVGGPRTDGSDFQSSLWLLSGLGHLPPSPEITGPFGRVPDGNAASVWYIDHAASTLTRRDPTNQFGEVATNAFALIGDTSLIWAIPENELRLPTGPPGFVTLGEFLRMTPEGQIATIDDPAAYSFLELVLSGYPLHPVPLCVEGADGCDARFQVTVPGADGAEVDDTGLFWFDDPENLDLLVKVLDGCMPYNNFWVFANGLTDVEVEITVTDTQTGAVEQYNNPLGQPAAAITDTEAFATCP